MSDTPEEKSMTGQIITSVIGVAQFIMWVIAIVLSFKANDGFDITHFCIAFYCPACYLGWYFLVRESF